MEDDGRDYIPMRNAQVRIKLPAALVEKMDRRNYPGNTREEHVRYFQFIHLMSWIESDLLISDIDEPPDTDIVARFMSPDKFLWVLAEQSIPFVAPTKFDDPHDGKLPQPLIDGVTLALRNHFEDGFVNHAYKYLNKVRDVCWVSCWTHLTEGFDNNLIWHKYAGGNHGVAFTCQYGDLKQQLNECHRDLVARQSDGKSEKLISGLVNYEPDEKWRNPTFEKRRIFTGEKEVRFVISEEQFPQEYVYDTPVRAISFSKARFRKIFRMKFADDAPVHHVDAIRRIVDKHLGA